MARLPTLLQESSSVPSVFGDFFTDIDRMFSRWGPLFEGERGGDLALDVEEIESGYLVKVNVPGIDKDKIGITVQDQRLTISCNLEEREEKKEDSRYLYRERRTASMQRTVELPYASPEGVEAHLKEGVLEIHVKKDQARSPRRIEIH